MKLIKKSKFKSFAGSSLTLCGWPPAGSRKIGGSRGRSPESCTDAGRACRKQLVLKKTE